VGEVRDPLRYFRIEARELIDQISAAVLDLDQQPGPDLVARLLRFAHTLKGAARVVRQQEIAERAHAFEEVLVPHRGASERLPGDELRELLRLNDEIEQRVTALERSPRAGGDTPPPEAGAGGTTAAGTDGDGQPDQAGTNGDGQPDQAGVSGGPDEAGGAEGAGEPGGAGQAREAGQADQSGQAIQSDPAHESDRAHESHPTHEPHRTHESQPAHESDRAHESHPTHASAEARAAGGGADRPAEAATARPATGGASTPAVTAEPAPRSPTADLDELLDAIGEATARIAPLREGGQTLARLHRGVESLSERLRIGRDAAGNAAVRAGLHRLAADLSGLGRRLTDAVDQVERELDEVRGRAEGLRLVGCATIFTALHRAVHDAAETEGKRVRFVGRGGELRMGPQLLNQVSGAFLHVVRNAVVHGIEPAAQRSAAGKPAEGTVVVEVERRGRWATFRCTDDGRGFDLAALRRVAQSRGILPPGHEPAPDELIDLVLRGGISTSAGVTDVAGRGIGMDVARDLAQQLRGSITVTNRPGEGATVELTVPLTLLSMNGLIVEAGGTVAIMPLDTVRRCTRLGATEAAAALATGRLAHDDEVVPFLPLVHTLHAGATAGDVPGSGVAVVISADGESVAVGVDRLAGITTLVARPLPELAPAAPVIGSVAIDLDGNPRLVLDPHGLVAESLGGLRAGGGEPVPAPPRLPILVVDDSLTTRMLERSILESAGYEVDLAASGEEGLEKAQARRYGLFLTDIDMPGIDGFEFVRRTRADPALAVVPAIMVSSRATAQDRQRGAEAGASAYVVKGEFNQEELLGHIRRLIL
jgi:two-component system, chemotaxis family, sensor kinase CheA